MVKLCKTLVVVVVRPMVNSRGLMNKEFGFESKIP